MKRLLFKYAFAFLFFIVQSGRSEILNPSFENQHLGQMPAGMWSDASPGWGMPDNWQWRMQGKLNGHGNRSPAGRTDGSWTLYVFAADNGPHAIGDYLEFYQVADLSGYSRLKLDVKVEREVTNAVPYISINKEELWSSNQIGQQHLDLDISRFGANSEIELGVKVINPFGSNADGWTYFDNLQLATPEPATLLLLGLGAVVLRKRKRVQN